MTDRAFAIKYLKVHIDIMQMLTSEEVLNISGDVFFAFPSKSHFIHRSDLQRETKYLGMGTKLI